MSEFFIRRPIVAMVIAIMMVLVGAISIIRLPVAQFPDIVPPETRIQASFVGADAQTLEQSVATPIEEQMSGVDNMNYMYSVNSSAGTMQMIVDFEVGTNPNTDLILTQMRESQAAAQLPLAVADYGVIIQKTPTAPLMLIAVYSPHGSYDAAFLSNFAYINLNDPLTRVHGVSNINVFGAGQYAMRLWLRPDKMARLGLTVTDLANAVAQQNTVNPAGTLGGAPSPPHQQYTYSVRAQGRLETPEEFGDIIVRESPQGGVVRLRDVGRAELGVQTYTLEGRLNGAPSAVLAIYPLPGTNALDTERAVLAEMNVLHAKFPQDISYVVSLDQTRAVSEGFREILITLGIALVLVILVVYLFLQSWRATLIPMLAVPVSLIGTFTIFPLLGFTINTLSLFGIVLAIGLVVDDAIVVVEAVERHIEDGMMPRAAARQAMREISGPVVGIALVLSAVFVPTTFVPGITGRLYQQFAATIAISVILSAFNALSLSPALAALLLRPGREPHRHGFFGWFNRMFESGREHYVRISGALTRKSALAVVLLLGFAVAGVWFGKLLPATFLPDEDQGYVYVNLQLPPASSLERTGEAAHQVEQILMHTPGVQYTTSVIGFSLLSFTQTTYNAFFFVTLQPWNERTNRQDSYQAIKVSLNRALSQLPVGTAFSFSPPQIPGVGTSGGVTMVLEDRAGHPDISYLAQETDVFLAAARKRPEIADISTSLLPSVPQQFTSVDRAQVLKQGVQIQDVYNALQTYLGGLFVNYFNRFGRQWQVYLEADAPYRASPSDLSQYYVRNAAGAMVPLSTVASIRPGMGPEFVLHYNEYKAAQINVTAAPGVSSQQAMDALQQVFAQTMPSEMGYDYMAMSFQENMARQGVSPSTIFGFSVLFVFLILAALYESWTLPFSVLLSTPVAVFGAFFMLWLRRTISLLYLPPYLVQMENDVYVQIGLVMLIGLAAKNAILIVEFAKTEYESGHPLAEAALTGARLRLRPILMTSLAFICGCIPLWTASGAEFVSRQVMGTAVIGGMLAASALGIFLVPAIFYAVERVSGNPAAGPPPQHADSEEPA